MANKKRIAIIARSTGLEYDDRIRKECLALLKWAEIKIFVFFENNIAEEGITSYGVPYKSFRLISRKIFPSGELLFLKSIELYFKVKKKLKNYDIIWSHEEYTFLIPLFSKKNKCIWDLHELPKNLMNKHLQFLFRIIENNSRLILHANAYRIKYIREKGLIKDQSKHDYIRNYPDNVFLKNNGVISGTYGNFKLWLSDSKYVFLQGLFSEGRYPFNTVAAILKSTDLKMVVIGKYQDQVKSVLMNEFGDHFNKRVFFTGQVDQLEISKYLINAFFTIIFYNIDKVNNRYCEPNRFFQALAYSIPVIAGSNEPMKDIIDKYKVGISIKSDGRALPEISEAINGLLSNYSIFKSNCELYKDEFVWKDSFVKNKWF